LSSTAAPDPVPPGAAESHATFFRQGGWLVVATVSGGVFMLAVQMAAGRWMKPPEYGVFVALLKVFLLMSIPSAGLQIVFARQTAAAVTDLQQRQLTATLRAVLAGTFLIWVLMALAALARQSYWIAMLKIANPAALWATVLIGLASLWSPILKGMLQGAQNFLGLGNVLILDGLGRFTAIVVILGLGGQAAGGMTGALIGQIVSLAVSAWLLRHSLFGAGGCFEWRPWLRRVVPLTLGIGAVQFMANTDVVYVQSIFSKDQTPLYSVPAMIGFAMVTITSPLAAVMFPKIVRSATLTRNTKALQQTMAATAVLCVVAALSCTVFPKLPLQIMFFSKPAYWEAWPLVPWFAWCLVPLILANVLISNLLARESFAAVPWLVLTAVGYGMALAALKPHLLQVEAMAAFRTVVQTLGAFDLLLLGIAGFFTWRDKTQGTRSNPQPGK
jgi:O-antigen/teichoic acid export membrane protein